MRGTVLHRALRMVLLLLSVHGPGSSSGVPVSLEPPMDTEVRRYRVIEAVGRGGFGTVYRAELVGPSGFTKEVALKVLNPDAPEAVGVAERLRDEARVLGKLRHRAIVKVDGLHLLNGRWTVVMEFVEGVDLKQLLADRAGVPPGIALEIVQEVANALHYAFEMSVDRSTVGVPTNSLRLLHRDIKPGNIQLTAAGEVKVLDFGVARADFADREAQTQSIYFGSLNYMSPERLDGIDDHKGDIYALGALLYELVLGEPLGRTSASRERHDARLREALAKLWERVPDEDLYRTVAECLLYDIDARPTARELERACRNLRPRFGAPWLSEWAEDIVPGLLQARDPIDDDLSGATLVEQGGVSGGVTSAAMDSAALDAGRKASRPDRRRSVVLVAAAASALVVVLGGGLAASVWLLPKLGDGAAQVAPTEDPGMLDELGAALEDPGTAQSASSQSASSQSASSQSASSQSAPAVELGSAGSPVGADTAAEAQGSTGQHAPTSAEATVADPADRLGSDTPASQPAAAEPAGAEPAAAARAAAEEPAGAAPASAARAEPEPEPEPEEAAPAPAGTGFVRLVTAPAGTRVTLVGDAGTFDPGRVPSGTYTVRVAFADGTRGESRVEVGVEQTVRLSCTSGLGCVGF